MSAFPMAVRWIRDRAFPLRDAAGRVILGAGVAEDVTERRQPEMQLRQARMREMIGRLAGRVAHDFNDLLSVIFAMPKGGSLIVQTRHLALDPAYAKAQPGLRRGPLRPVGRLSVVLSFVQQSGAHIVVHSFPGIGTTFKICLPAVGALATRPLQSPDKPVRGSETWRIWQGAT